VGIAIPGLDRRGIAATMSPWAVTLPISVDRHTAYQRLLGAVLEGTGADAAWFSPRNDAESLVVSPPAADSRLRTGLSEFPTPPSSPALVQVSDGDSAAEWCRANAVAAVVVAPVSRAGAIIGTVGLLAYRTGVLGGEALRRLDLAAWVMADAYTTEERHGRLTRRFMEINQLLGQALTIDRTLGSKATYQHLTHALGDSLEATYCRIAVRQGDRLRIQAAHGRRTPTRGRDPKVLPLAGLKRCQEALALQQAVVCDFDQPEFAADAERDGLFSPTTRMGILLPFRAGSLEGLLLIAEERDSPRQSLVPELLATLEHVARILGIVLQMTRLFERKRRLERRRHATAIEIAERKRLARDLHDEVGQALSTLLLRVRWSLEEGEMSRQDLEAIEDCAQSALDSSRSMAQGLRRRASGTDPLLEARIYAETMLHGIGCRFSWRDVRADTAVDSVVVREIAQVIKESVTNIARHSRATSATIRVAASDGRIRVTIRDNGVGLPSTPRGESGPSGLGLVGNTERLAQIGGTFQVRNSEAGGTVVVVEAPRR
jgi:two-component system sensor histidine kinase NreB